MAQDDDNKLSSLITCKIAFIFYEADKEPFIITNDNEVFFIRSCIKGISIYSIAIMCDEDIETVFVNEKWITLDLRIRSKAEEELKILSLKMLERLE